ncbi:Peptidase M16C associated family protein [Clavispora lusitaniae]|uniref:Peptidase M16C associated family protein n=1 Tax=Clavispora lusitaniae TaxID=36911 RepID=UPI0016A30FF9|nr:Mitochondrial presequence protease [Clavispora lusitaniae]KAF7583899.1 Peptidase M16C associated family protein [Clavispora lusitaniae]
MLRNNRTSLNRHLQRRLMATFSQAETLSKYPVGLSMHGFSIEKVQPVPEFSLVAVKLKHGRTGSEHLHLDAPMDKNNVFSVALKTNPPDCTGVPHILEHTTLCGSYKYPVRDPFFKMLNRSLSNFMNAMTGHDYTFYPFATTNRKDFSNLMDVYLSSVFEPLLSYDDFMQEGWRLEQSDLTDKKSPIEFKGVVYNEMKGQYSNSSYLYWIKYQEAIYPSLKNSGGNPAKIPDLNYEDLIEFHSSNYHPSNAKTYTYGSFPLEEHLKSLNEFYQPFGARSTKPVIKPCIFEQQPTVKLHNVEVPGPIDTMSSKPTEEQYKSSLTWFLGNPLEEDRHYEVFKWKVLNSLLCDGHNSPFYQELIETGYGEDFSPNSGLDMTTSMLSFTIGLNGLSKTKVNELESKIKDIVTDKVLPELTKKEKSVFHERVQAILHQLELGFKKHKPDFGLGLLNSIVPSWVNGQEPVKSLQVQFILNRFKEDYEEKGLVLFEDMLKSSLLNEQTQRFNFTMAPQESYNDALVTEEEARLASRVNRLNEEDKEVIFKRSQKLLEKQADSGDVSVLPTLTLDDIPRQGDMYKLSFSSLSHDGDTIQKRVVNTNDLVYVSAAKNLSFLPQRLLKYLPLFNSCLTNLAGTENIPITELENKIQQKTGGLTFSAMAKTDPYDIGKPHVKFVMSGMALKEKSENIYELWFEILNNTMFSANEAVLDKLQTLIKNLGQNQMNMIADRGHSYANSYSNSQLTPTKWINDLLGGVEQVKFVSEMNKKLDENGKEYLKEEILPILQEIQTLITTGSTEGLNKGFNYNIVADKVSVAENVKLIEKFNERMLTSSGSKSLANELQKLKISAPTLSRTILNLPFQVGYASLAHTGAAYSTKEGAALQVLSQIVTYKHLHSVIREANGAYGGGLNYDGLGGTLNFYSYRDPNAIKSSEAFALSYANAKKNLMDGKWDAKALQEAKLAIFQSVDAPSHISSQGSGLFLENITEELRQERRENFLDVSLEDLKNVNEKYLGHAENQVFTVIGDTKILDAGKGWEVKNF